MNMDKKIAVALALVVVFGVFFGNTLFNTEREVGESTYNKFKDFVLPLPKANWNLPVLGNAGVEAETWIVFEEYRGAAKAHDLEKIKMLSHQISPTCSDSARREECNTLMDGVYGLTKDWKQSEFTKALSDDRQTILATEFEKKGDVEPVQSAIFFTHEGEMIKVLGIQFCFESSEGDRCFNPEKLKTDSNNNGWWDDVEAVFYK